MTEEKDVVIIKLSTSEEIVGFKVEDGESQFKIGDPYTLNFNYLEQGVTMTPFCYWSDDHVFTIEKAHIINIANCSKKVAGHYLDLIHQLDMQATIKNIDDLKGIINRLDKALQVTDDEVDIDYESPTFIEGNNTKH